MYTIFPKQLQVVGWLVTVLIVFLHGKAYAVTSPGWRELAVQPPDITLKPTAPAYLPIELKTVELDNNFPTDSGLYAMSTVPGLSITSAYAYVPAMTNPTNIWTPIGEAEGFSTGTTPWFGHFNGTQGISIQKFAVSYDGTAPSGTQGSIQIAVNEGGDVDFFPRIIGSINVYVRSVDSPTWLTIIATKKTISDNRLILDHPYLNGNPTANVFAMHLYNPPGRSAMYWNHPISVAYDSKLARWTIQNDDSAAMVQGVAFNVRIDPSAIVVRGPNWRKLGGRLSCSPDVNIPPITAVRINHSSSNNNPFATIIVTSRSPDPKALAVKYVAPNWYIVHADGSGVPECGLYNVQVIGFSEYFNYSSSFAGWLDPFVSNGAGVSINGTYVEGPRDLSFWWQLGKQDEPIIVTQSLSPPAVFYANPAVDNSYIGVAYSGGSKPNWQIINEDGTSVPNDATFNAWGQPQLTP